jgi:hypothetical protein
MADTPFPAVRRRGEGDKVIHLRAFNTSGFTTLIGLLAA